MNREPQNKEPQNIEVKNIVLFLSKTSAVRNSLFDIRYSKWKTTKSHYGGRKDYAKTQVQKFITFSKCSDSYCLYNLSGKLRTFQEDLQIIYRPATTQ